MEDAIKDFIKDYLKEHLRIDIIEKNYPSCHKIQIEVYLKELELTKERICLSREITIRK